MRVHTNPEDPFQRISIHNPTGTGQTPITGGRCNDPKRPVVVVVHGVMAGIDAQLVGSSLLYSDIINHFVSTGNTVIFASWPTMAYDFAGSVTREDRALVLAKKLAPRGDFSRLGIVGHSMGGGATPYLAQQAAARGWGSEALWLFQLAPVFTTRVGSGPIKVPGHTRVVVETYDNDFIVDARSGIQQYRDYAIPSSQKKYVMVRTDDHGGPAATLLATHTSPNSLLAPEDAIRFYGIYRVGDALESCALWGKNCDADLTYMGKWSDGREVRRSISSANPVDAGPPAIIFSLFGIALECESSFNPRAHTCPPSRP
ncbi:MAG TPA: hypothetical protein PKG94_04470 [Gordonia sp. (in: high G+C Gram-positive bacteria)]|uniref:hypothetical protein n=1 Tax=Gordonia sp. (in: high G+C Gram-positive bacteria) TaxID=84139 RepID=UPI002C5C8160|nr:hypothetical protein [Gordonia sp. (in: high G+C Gram-positive bacteria)]HNP56210.1 hypothetical protein [Gordonia sp. (in: high G+C Gram-positive bacteria)]